MIDLVYDVKPEHWGVVEEIEDGCLTIFRNEWAPGLWAGVSNIEVVIKQAGGPFYKCAILITNVDLNDRKLFFKCSQEGHNIEPGDTIHYMERVNGR